VNFEEIKKIISLLEESSFLKKLSIKDKDFEISLEKDSSKIETPSNACPEQGTEKFFFVTSPMVGTFYNAASPEIAPFVKLKDRVEEDSVVCIIEAMKVMNEVKAQVKGKIVEILVDNAHPVEFGTKLFRILEV